MGIFIAMSPFFGIQTVLALGLSWVFGLNTVVVLVVSYVINNPFTMFPIVAIDYCTGYFLLEYLGGLSLYCYNPRWLNWVLHGIEKPLHKYLGFTHIAVLHYLIGGLILALLVSVPWYWVLKYVFTRLLAKEKVQK